MFVAMLLALVAPPALAEDCPTRAEAAQVCPTAVAVGILDSCASWTDDQRACVKTATDCNTLTSCLAPKPDDEKSSCERVCDKLYPEPSSHADRERCVPACEALLNAPRQACYLAAPSTELSQLRCGKFKSPEANTCLSEGRSWCQEGCCGEGEVCAGSACVPAMTAAEAPGCAQVCSHLQGCSDTLELNACLYACESKLDPGQQRCFASTACAGLVESCGPLGSPKSAASEPPAIAPTTSEPAPSSAD